MFADREETVGVSVGFVDYGDLATVQAGHRARDPFDLGDLGDLLGDVLVQAGDGSVDYFQLVDHEVGGIVVVGLRVKV